MKHLIALFFKKFTGCFGTKAAKRRTALLFAGILLVSSTTGCQLADADMRSSNDTLIGVYVTREFIDPAVGEDDYYTSSFGSVTEKGTDANRVYGNLDKENDTISFPGINGFALLCVQQEEEGNAYFKTINECFSDTSTSIINDSCEVSGTLYYDSSKVANHYYAESTEELLEEFEDFDASRVTTEEQEDGTILYDYATEGEDLTLYMHPIYETANGEVYLISQPGGTLLSQGGDISTSFSSSESSTADGSTTESSYRKFTVSVKEATPVEKIIFTQFDSKGNVLQEDTYTSANMPESYSRKKGSAYILVTSTDLDGTITYDIINQEDGAFPLCLPTDNIFCEDASIDIKD